MNTSPWDEKKRSEGGDPAVRYRLGPTRSIVSNLW